MTCREKLQLEHPECVGIEHIGGAKQCPRTYGYLPPAEWCPFKNGKWHANDADCSECWDREIPDDDFGQYVKLSMIKFCPFCGKELKG